MNSSAGTGFINPHVHPFNEIYIKNTDYRILKNVDPSHHFQLINLR
jgi:hypothetical protein